MEAQAVVLAAIAAVERRDVAELNALYHPDVAFHWQPGLPYAGDFSGPALEGMTELFRQAWEPVQPNDATRRMDSVVIAATGDSVVVSYVTRGIDPRGTHFETPTLAQYRILDGRLRDARMYYYDLAGVIAFLHSARH